MQTTRSITDGQIAHTLSVWKTLCMVGTGPGMRFGGNRDTTRIQEGHEIRKKEHMNKYGAGKPANE